MSTETYPIVEVAGVACPRCGELPASLVSSGEWHSWPLWFDREFATMELRCPTCRERVTLIDPHGIGLARPTDYAIESPLEPAESESREEGRLMARLDRFAHLRCTCGHFRAAHHYQPGPPNAGHCLAVPGDGCTAYEQVKSEEATDDDA